MLSNGLGYSNRLRSRTKTDMPSDLEMKIEILQPEFAEAYNQFLLNHRCSLFYFNQTVEYFTPAIDSKYRSLQPLPLILITAMTDASIRKYIGQRTKPDPRRSDEIGL